MNWGNLYNLTKQFIKKVKHEVSLPVTIADYAPTMRQSGGKNKRKTHKRKPPNRKPHKRKPHKHNSRKRTKTHKTQNH